MPLITLNGFPFHYNDIVIFELDTGEFEIVGGIEGVEYELDFI